ncbi:DsbA family oxidoreductase [Paraburkholderia sp.]|uniref:DsbA family oxidoreductase n=1 Tax=Paraburkholderia sp. TaxID=1926495 RepID=UPI002384BAD8|nr:DsbA family oxidoreductase [Paraburkholderia sp.]MDE1182132.1 DsbA family oxidoreductase [Paraburkholderia sp.]
MQRIEIDVYSDFICPWCWIGHSNLAAALDPLRAEVEVSVRYLPFELNPSMAKDGMDRREYRTLKFGSWARSQSMDAQVATAGRAVGAPFDYSRVLRTPNTRLAHRLMAFAQSRHAPQQTDALYEALFVAYFSEGRDIGRVDTLVELAAAHGFDAEAVRADLQSADADASFVATENARRDAEAHGIHAVPSVVIGGDVVSGAQPPTVFATALRAVIARSAA